MKSPYEQPSLETWRETEALCEALINCSLQGIVILQNSGPAFVNHLFASMLGYASTEVLEFAPEQWESLVYPNDRSAVKACHEQLRNVNDRALTCNHRLFRKDGSICPVQMALSNIHYRGKPSVLAIYTDVSHQQSIEDAWHKIEFISNCSRNFMTLVNRDYVYETVNKAYTDTLGTPDDSRIIGKTMSEVWGDHFFREIIKNHIDRCFAGYTVNYEAWFKFHEMGFGYYEVTYYPYRNRDGEISHAVVVSHNITKRKQAEDALLEYRNELEEKILERTEDLRQSRNFLQALVDYLPVAVLVKEAKSGSYILWNKASENLFGVAESEALGKNAHDLFPRSLAEQLSRADEKAFREKRIQYLYDIRIENTRSEKRYLNSIKVPIFEKTEAPGYILSMCEDITDGRQTKEALIEAKAAAEAANKAKTIFLANMSHEIRTPMSSILGMADMLWETPLNPEQKHFVRIFRDAGKALLVLLNEILDLTKVETGMLELEQAEFDLFKTIEKLIEVMKHRAEAKGLALKCQISPDTPACLVGDGFRLRQILVNLIGNAIKFTETGEILATVSVIPPVAPESPADSVIIEFNIKDSGIGIPADKREVIFQQFTQADSGIGRKYGGAGLGLTICKRLAEMMGGKIEVESELGKGSVFTVTIPFKIAAATLTEKADFSRKNQLSGIDQPLKILLVEDIKENQMIFAFYLKAPPYIMEIAENGLEGVEKYKAGAFDMVFMDIEMPVMDGYEAARRIRSYERHHNLRPVPIIALTAHAMKSAKKKFFEAGMNGYVTKPIETEKLYKLIERWVPSVSERPQPPAAAAPQDEQRTQFPETLPGIQANDVCRRLNGNIDLFHSLIQDFLENQSDSGNQLQAALEQRDFPTARRLVHTLKGLSGNISARDLHRTLEELEAALAGAPAPENIAAHLKTAQHQLNIVTESIAAYLRGLEPPPSAESSAPINLNAELRELSALLSSNSPRAESCFLAIKPQLNRLDSPEHVQALEKLLRQYNYKEAVQRFAEILNRIGRIPR